MVGLGERVFIGFLECYRANFVVSCIFSGEGGVAQLGERRLCKPEVIGSNPFTSTIPKL